ncbi:hypothetical protein ACOMHN_035819 [Nucella lapillus]
MLGVFVDSPSPIDSPSTEMLESAIGAEESLKVLCPAVQNRHPVCKERLAVSAAQRTQHLVTKLVRGAVDRLQGFVEASVDYSVVTRVSAELSFLGKVHHSFWMTRRLRWRLLNARRKAALFAGQDDCARPHSDRQPAEGEAGGSGDGAVASTSGVTGLVGSGFDQLAPMEEQGDNAPAADQGPNFKVPPRAGSQRVSWQDESLKEDCPPQKHRSQTRSRGFKRSLSFDSMDLKVQEPDKSPVPAKRRLMEMDDVVDDSLNDVISWEKVEKQSASKPEGLFELIDNPVMNESSLAPDGSPPAYYPKFSWYGDQDDNTPMALPPASRRHSHSESEATIKEAVHKMTMDPNLIADSSKVCLLPITSGKHQDLKNISHETMADLLNGKYAADIKDFVVVDCRFPYEYNGGHIRNAVNVYTKDTVTDKYLKDPVKVKDPAKRFILIFHCEFSSERGPALYRHLRTCDRQINAERYPMLHYPEMYLMEGGYSVFYSQHKDLCEPKNYIPMLHRDYAEELAKYNLDRKKSGDKKGKKNMGDKNQSGSRRSGTFRSLNL